MKYFQSIPGVPGEDYPIYAEVPETAFSCDGQVDGGKYYILYYNIIYYTYIRIKEFMCRFICDCVDLFQSFKGLYIN